MEIAVQACDLDHARIDGTRVYLSHLLRHFGSLAPETRFSLYHGGEWNPLLAPPSFSNYQERVLPKRFAWMQTAFARALFCDRPDKLFLPIQAAPFFLPKPLEVTATIHDLAFQKFPETFPLSDRVRLSLMLETVVRRADKLIAVSEATRKDLLAAYPALSGRVRVIHHGFDGRFFSEAYEPAALREQLSAFRIKPREYILFVGALQPRKNLGRLIAAFEAIRAERPELKLVLCGEKAWLSGPIIEAIQKSPARDAIIQTGKVSFEVLRDLYRGARVFAFPSLYEGFGLPLLEAFAAGVPVVAADNSSLREVAGAGALYCDAQDPETLAQALREILENSETEKRLLAAAQEELKRFSWERSARETLAYILEG